jgi:hypothetical protein
VESAQVEANRQFFDEFDAIVENDAIGAYKFLRDHKKELPNTMMSIWRSNRATKHAKLRGFRQLLDIGLGATFPG